MPVMDGLELLDRVRSDGHDLAVVMATAFGSEEVAIEALRRMVDDDLRKPLEPVEFQAVLDPTVARHLLARQNRHRHAELDENRRQLEAEVARAAVVQAQLLPQAEPDIAGWDVAAVCVPARAVGDDFIDWRADGHSSLTVTLGDVMGKGMAAGLLMTTVRAALRAVGTFEGPGQQVAAVDRGLATDLDRSGSFIALVLGRIDLVTGDVRSVDAGHGLALVRRADGRVEPLRGPQGLPLGAELDSVYGEGQTRLDRAIRCSSTVTGCRVLGPTWGASRRIWGRTLRGGRRGHSSSACCGWRTTPGNGRTI
jgi:serine phosphatase RsbU (regulator of sigma subunit)